MGSGLYFKWPARSGSGPNLLFRVPGCGEGGVVQRSLQREKDSGDSGK